jgi:pantetheine-phosphate adenylyltransferase
VPQSHTVFYPGSFDPATFGHFDLIGRAARLFGRVVVGVGIHPGKAPLFTGHERVEMLREEIALLTLPPSAVIEVVTFDALAVDAAKAHGATAMVRGVRDTTDVDYEMRMAGMNAAMAPDLETIFLPGAAANKHIAATLVRQIAQMGGDITSFVPAGIARRLREKLTPPSAL